MIKTILLVLFTFIGAAFANQKCITPLNTETNCLVNGCQWIDGNCFHINRKAPERDMCDFSMPPQIRLPCGSSNIDSIAQCNSIGCCWDETPFKSIGTVPKCFHTKGLGYQLMKMSFEDGIYTGHLKQVGRGPFGNDIENLEVKVITQHDRVRIQIKDSVVKRYEVPYSFVEDYSDQPFANAPFKVTYTTYPELFTLQIVRKSDNAVLFDSKKEFTFSNQFIEISTSIPKDSTLYGLGQHTAKFALEDDEHDYQIYTVLSHNNPSGLHIPEGGESMYGSHAYLQLASENTYSPDKLTHQSIFLHNSNGMDVILRKKPRQVTYRVIGGILDFFVFSGETPYDLMNQYSALIGKPYMPPRWGTGFQICRWGYENTAQVKSVVAGMEEAGMPMDVMWTDIDFMDQNRPLTYDQKNFADLPNFVRELHAKDMHYMTIFEPAIPSRLGMSYDPYARGIREGLFIQNHDGSLYDGKVWPGRTHFVDFFHPNATRYWEEGLAKFRKIIPVDGMWLDMNEPADFCDGQCPDTYIPLPKNVVMKDGYPFDANYPPFVPGQFGSGKIINYHTVPMDAKQYIGEHYDVHSLYGFSETRMSGIVLPKLMGVRPMIVARSSFPGTGRYGSTWLGDNWSKWVYLHMSITGILTNSMFMLPFTGADVCGFNSPAEEEMCVRWMQLGAFQPFYRNHNAKGFPSQEPHIWPKPAQKAMLGAMNTRYSLISYFYTLVHKSHAEALPINRALIWEFINQPDLRTIDTQFMLGPALMVSPALADKQRTVDVTFPTEARWFDYYSFEEIQGGVKRTLEAPIDKINLHLRGGNILTRQSPGSKIADQLKSPFELLITLNHNQNANGELFWDNGNGLETFEKGAYSSVKFMMVTRGTKSMLTTSLPHLGNTEVNDLVYKKITVVGLSECPYPSAVTVGGQHHGFSISCDSDLKVLSLELQKPLPLVKAHMEIN